MSWFHAIFRQRRLERDLDKELRFHLAEHTDDLIAAGRSPEEARREAMIDFGGLDPTKEACRDVRSGQWLEILWRDLAYAARQLRKTPSFTATIVVTLALGIGSCTAIYSIVDAVLLHPYSGLAEPERHVYVTENLLPRVTGSRLSAPAFLELQKSATCFESMGAFRTSSLTLTGVAEPVALGGARVTAGFFELMGIRLVLGRGFTPEEDKVGNDKVVVLGYRTWQTVFGGKPDIVGQKVQFNEQPYTVVGVAGPDWAQNAYVYDKYDNFMPMAFTDADRRSSNFGFRLTFTWALLKRGVTLAQAQAELDAIATRLATEHPATNQGWKFSLTREAERKGAGMRAILWTLLAAVGGVLLIACANVANLLLARANTRQREMAVRAAMGASRGRLVRQLLTESVLLALLGGGAGLLVAQWALGLARGYAVAGMSQLAFVRLNLGMLLFALGLSLATGLLFGLAPAWLGSATGLNKGLKLAARGNTEPGARNRVRGGLVVLEVAGATVLLVSVGLLLRSFARMSHLDAGYLPERITVMQAGIPTYRQSGPPAARYEFGRALLERLRVVPGVEAVSFATSLPSFAPTTIGFAVEGRPNRPIGEWPACNIFTVAEGYIETMGIRLLRGRTFTVRDDAKAPPVILIGDSFAKQQFPDEDPLGKRLTFSGINRDTTQWEIVGVVADVVQGVPGAERNPQVYVPFQQKSDTVFWFVVRSQGAPATVQTLLKPQVYAVDKNRPVDNLYPLTEAMGFKLSGQRFTLHLLAVFSFVALVIATVGIYGVIAYHVSQRTGEIGIRMALGASRGDVLRLVIGHGARLVGLGLAAGLVGALAAGRAIESMLYQVSARDPLTLVVIMLFFSAVAGIACLLPARRATKIDPMVALRTE